MSPFTPGELEVMQVLWQDAPLKPAQIQARMDRPINNAALRSVLRVLLEKGHVDRRKAGGVYYTPKPIVDYMVKKTIGRLLGDDETRDGGRASGILPQRSLSAQARRHRRRRGQHDRAPIEILFLFLVETRVNSASQFLDQPCEDVTM